MAALFLMLVVIGIVALIWSASKQPRHIYSPAAGSDSQEQPAKTYAVVRLEGEGDYEFEVVGESHYQDALNRICGGRCEDGHEFETTAMLLPEDDNPHDHNAIAIFIEGEKVAYLSRDDAVDYRKQMAASGFAGMPAHCDAMIVGGWERTRRNGTLDQGSFGVKLDIDEPLQGQLFHVPASGSE